MTKLEIDGLTIETVHDHETISTKVRTLGQQLQEELGQEDPVLVSILGGSVIFLADLVRAIERPVRFEFIQVSYTEAGDGAERLDILYPIPFDVRDASVLLVKDVVGSGITETYLHQQLRAHGAREVRFVALIDVPLARKTDLTVDYRVFTAEEHGTFIGYGLKHQGRLGNLPFLGRLSQPV